MGAVSLHPRLVVPTVPGSIITCGCEGCLWGTKQGPWVGRSLYLFSPSPALDLPSVLSQLSHFLTKPFRKDLEGSSELKGMLASGHSGMARQGPRGTAKEMAQELWSCPARCPAGHLSQQNQAVPTERTRLQPHHSHGRMWGHVATF